MSDPKQPGHLNGAYYGPPVPPQQTYHRVGRHSSCGPCCLISTLFKFFISIIVILGVAALVFWLVFRPNHIKVYVSDASLTQFDLNTTTNNLNYNLSLTTTFRNPNRHIGMYYDYIEARALYDDSRFGYTPIPAFYQGHKSTTSMQAAFSGSGVLVGDTVATTYNREKGEGYYYVEVKMYTRLRLKVWFVRPRVKPEIDCVLRLPVPGSSNAKFEETKCHIHWRT